MAKEKKITQFLLPELMLIQNTQNIMARIQFPFSTKSKYVICQKLPVALPSKWENGMPKFIECQK